MWGGTPEKFYTSFSLVHPKVLNMVMLGAYIAKTGVVKADTLIDYVKEVFGSKKPELVELNKKAIEKGAASAK